jgi:X-X-X-Leu-X-X-Gly heptad repeat protein
MAAALVVATAGLGACSRDPGVLHLVGTVEDSLTVVAMPAIGMPVVDLDAGFAATPVRAPVSGQGQTASARPGSPAQSITGLGGVWRLATVAVREGSPVSAGQQIATVEDGILAAGVRAAEATAATAAAQVPVLADRISEVDDKRATLADKRGQLTKALATLTSTRATLTTNRSQLSANQTTLQRNRTNLAATLEGLLTTQAKLRAILASLPTDPSVPLPPGTPTRAEITAQLAALATGIANTTAGLAKLDVGLAQLRSGLTQIDSGLAQLSTKASQVRTGLTTVDNGRSALAEARVQLVDAQGIARAVADTAQVAVALAREQHALTTVTAPVTGVVVATATAGDLLAPGAVLATIRPTGPATVRVWLAPDQRAVVCLKDAAQLRGDWMPGDADVAGTVTLIGDHADYPPSSNVTDEVHLTRAIPVDVTTAHDPLPAGVPVEVTLRGCHPPGT